MSQIRRRKAANKLAARMAEELLNKHRHPLRGVTTIEGVRRAIGGELGRTRQAFNDSVTPERRAEKLFDGALAVALEAEVAARVSVPRPIAPKVATVEDVGDEDRDVGTAYRDAPPEEEVQLKPSRLAPPPSALARMRNQLLFGAAWIVVVVRFSIAIRAHGVSKLAAVQALLGTIAILPIVLGVLLLVLPRR